MTTAETREAALPPGPRGALLPLQFLTARHRMLPVWRRQYGDLFTLRMGPKHNIVALCTPELVREALTGDPAAYHAGEGNAVVAPIMGAHSILSVDEDAHLRLRKRLMPAFNGAALRGYRTMMTEVAEDFAERWPVGRPVPAHTLTSAVSMEVIVRVVYGMDDGDRLTALRPLLRGLMPRSALEFLGWLRPKLQRHRPWRRSVERLAAADELINAELADRRAATDLADRADVLSTLIAADPDLTDAELRDHLVTLLISGFGTTSTALAWALYELARNPEVQRAAHRAADDGDDAYLTAVVKEAMRSRPVLYTVPRRLALPVELGGYLLPAGTELAIGLGPVLTDAAHHPRPDRFDPTRFVDADPASGTWIPFGAGIRRCIGAGFALQESAAVLRALLRRYDFAPVGRPEAPKLRGVVLAPAKGGQVLATPRAVAG